MNSLEATSLCVKCGLCLPHCPTFQLTGIETESPRGRISLMQALANDATPPPGSPEHLNNCLQCRACEAMCPSRVPFNRLMDTAKTLAPPKPERTALSMAAFSTSQKKLFSAFAGFYRNRGLQDFARRTRLLPTRLRRLDRLLTRLPRVFTPTGHARQNDHRPVVEILAGCISSFMDADALDAAARLLEQAGYAVRFPAKSQCCGALHQHSGNPERAQRLAQASISSMGPAANARITSVASGCTAQLREYGALYPDITPDGFGDRVMDIHRLLLDAPGFADLRFSPLERRVALHLPCSQRHALKETQVVIDLVNRIPGIELIVLGDAASCCGAAGDYCVTHPFQADELLARTLLPLDNHPPPLLLSSNIGCALHLASGCEARGWNIEVMHALTLMDRQLCKSPAD
jgi:glycolate oxidase iron-sulfur subunit